MVPIPARMAHLDRDRRGYPIFFMAYRDQQGRPHFTINDERKRQIVIARDLCSICGAPLLRGRWFLGGDLSAFDANGAYIDPPMHDECVHYALRVCPYLASPSWSHYVAGRTLDQRADIRGSVRLGMRAALIDRSARGDDPAFPTPPETFHLRSLFDVPLIVGAAGRGAPDGVGGSRGCAEMPSSLP